MTRDDVATIGRSLQRFAPYSATALLAAADPDAELVADAIERALEEAHDEGYYSALCEGGMEFEHFEASIAGRNRHAIETVELVGDLL